jgi:hypothetical protein
MCGCEECISALYGRTNVYNHLIRRCEECISALYGWTNVYIHLMCRKSEGTVRGWRRRAPKHVGFKQRNLVYEKWFTQRSFDEDG